MRQFAIDNEIEREDRNGYDIERAMNDLANVYVPANRPASVRSLRR